MIISGVNFGGGGPAFVMGLAEPIKIPAPPTIGTATATGATTANVTFTAPTNNGGANITSYTATSSPGGITGTLNQAGSGTITVTGLTASTSYTFTVTATNSVGTSAASESSNSTTTASATIPITYLVVGASGASGGPGRSYGGGGGSGGASYGSTNITTGLTVTVGTSSGASTMLVGTGFTRTAYGGGGGAASNNNPNDPGWPGFAGGGGAVGDGNTATGGTGGVGGYYAPGGAGSPGTFSGGGGGGGSGSTTIGTNIAGGAGGAGGQRDWNSSSWNNIGTDWGSATPYSTGQAANPGVAAIQYPDSYAAASNTTGSVTITTAGGYRVYRWISPGTITF